MSLRLEDYRFKTFHWPPPKDCRNSETYLIGFDEDNQPYVVKWEKNEGSKGWVAATLSDSKASGSTAIPRHFVDDAVDKIIQYWAYAPALMRTVFRVKSENKKKKEDRDE